MFYSTEDLDLNSRNIYLRATVLARWWVAHTVRHKVANSLLNVKSRQMVLLTNTQIISYQLIYQLIYKEGSDRFISVSKATFEVNCHFWPFVDFRIKICNLLESNGTSKTGCLNLGLLESGFWNYKKPKQTMPKFSIDLVQVYVLYPMQVECSQKSVVLQWSPDLEVHPKQTYW